MLEGQAVRVVYIHQVQITFQVEEVVVVEPSLMVYSVLLL